MNKVKILVIDDEVNMRNLLSIFLTKDGLEVTESKNGPEALDILAKKSFDLIILDVMMPYMDGWEVCQKIRENLNTPILMLTARSETKDKIQGLNLGADDYLVKPFDQEELIARVFALLRRTSTEQTTTKESAVQSYGDIKIDKEGRQVQVEDQFVDLTPKEFELLVILATNQGRALSREILLENVWGHDFYGDNRTVDTHVKNIREKLRQAGLSAVPIQTVWGVGYKFVVMEEQK
jgi:two-component system response regulator ResD